MDKKSDKYIVRGGIHKEGWYFNKWCVFYPDKVFLCACGSKKDADKIAEALNLTEKPG